MPDVVVITPIFYGGRIIAFGASVAHKADVSGLVPGSSGAASREIFPSMTCSMASLTRSKPSSEGVG